MKMTSQNEISDPENSSDFDIFDNTSLDELTADGSEIDKNELEGEQTLQTKCNEISQLMKTESGSDVLEKEIPDESFDYEESMIKACKSTDADANESQNARSRMELTSAECPFPSSFLPYIYFLIHHCIENGFLCVRDYTARLMVFSLRLICTFSLSAFKFIYSVDLPLIAIHWTMKVLCFVLSTLFSFLIFPSLKLIFQMGCLLLSVALSWSIYGTLVGMDFFICLLSRVLMYCVTSVCRLTLSFLCRILKKILWCCIRATLSISKSFYDQLLSIAIAAPAVCMDVRRCCLRFIRVVAEMSHIQLLSIAKYSEPFWLEDVRLCIFVTRSMKTLSRDHLLSLAIFHIFCLKFIRWYISLMRLITSLIRDNHLYFANQSNALRMEVIRNYHGTKMKNKVFRKRRHLRKTYIMFIEAIKLGFKYCFTDNYKRHRPYMGFFNKKSLFLFSVCIFFFQPYQMISSDDYKIGNKLSRYGLTYDMASFPEVKLTAWPVFNDNQRSQNNKTSENGHPITNPSDDTPPRSVVHNHRLYEDVEPIATTSDEPHYPENDVFVNGLSDNGNPITFPSDYNASIRNNSADVQNQRVLSSFLRQSSNHRDEEVELNSVTVRNILLSNPTINTTANTYIAQNSEFSTNIWNGLAYYRTSITIPSSYNESIRNNPLISQNQIVLSSNLRQHSDHSDTELVLNSVNVRSILFSIPTSSSSTANSYNVPCSDFSSNVAESVASPHHDVLAVESSNGVRQLGSQRYSLSSLHHGLPTIRLNDLHQNGRNTQTCTGLYLPFDRPGGRYQSTCTLDNFLTIVYLSLLDSEELRRICQAYASEYDRTLYYVYNFIKIGDFDSARDCWLRYISHPRSSGSLYGSEREMIHGHVTQSCSTEGIFYCKRQTCRCFRTALSTGAIRLANRNFNNMDGTTDRTELLQRLLDCEASEARRSLYVNAGDGILGINRRTADETNHCRHCRRVYEPQPPMFLTIDVELIKDQLRNVDSIPETVYFNEHRYRLAGVTFHSQNGRMGHFSAMVMHQSRRWRYCNSSPHLTPYTGIENNNFLSFIVYRIM